MTEAIAEQIQSALASCRCSPCRTAVAAREAPPWSRPLLELTAFERSNGKSHTLRRYHPLNFDLLAPLNHDILSVHGVVDVDWMFRVALFSQDVVDAYLTYFSGKLLWNTARGIGTTLTGVMNAASAPMSTSFDERIEMLRRGDGIYRWEYGSVLDPANRNAPYVANAWLKPGVTLEKLFGPALAACRAPR